MQNFRIRIRKPDGDIIIRHVSFSQLCKIAEGSNANLGKFEDGEDFTAANGDNIHFMRYV